MPTKLAVKRLTASDLTFFDYQYRNSPAGKQKAINMNADVLVKLFPALGQIATGSQKYGVDLYLYGPGFRDGYNLQRKILKQEKNWRLNGEKVENPDDEPQRFDSLVPQDVAVLGFEGDIYPDRVRIVFLSQAETQDATLLTGFNSLLAQKTMIVLSNAQLEDVILQAQPDDNHPIYELTFKPVAEDMALGGTQIRQKLIQSPRHRKMSAEELQASKETANRVGRQGEAFVNTHFVNALKQGQIIEFEWVAQTDAINPFDFRIRSNENGTIVLDVKSTESDFDRILHVSYSELYRMAYGTERYDLYRVYKMEGSTARLRICEDLRGFAISVMDGFKQLPPDVNPDSVSFKPGVLPFKEEEIILSLEDIAPDEDTEPWQMTLT
jgi:hypothetical protein